MLRFRGNHYTARARAYQAPASTCNACPIKARCTDSLRGRIITRSFDEAYRKAMRRRSVWFGPLFDEARQWHGLRQFRLRGLPDVNIIGLLIAAART